MTKQITLTPVDLGFGWKATRAWSSGGPIVLIQANAPTGEIAKSRLDMQKVMFIDPPIEAKKEDIQHLVDALNAASDMSG